MKHAAQEEAVREGGGGGVAGKVGIIVPLLQRERECKYALMFSVRRGSPVAC